MSKVEELEQQKQSVQAELKQLENRHKILLNRKHKEERRERTHRLIEQGAILESVFPEIATMTGDEVKVFLQQKR